MQLTFRSHPAEVAANSSEVFVVCKRGSRAEATVGSLRMVSRASPVLGVLIAQDGAHDTVVSSSSE